MWILRDTQLRNIHHTTSGSLELHVMNMVPSISIREKYDTIYLPTSIKNPVELIELKNIFNLFWKPKMFNCTFKFIIASYLNMFASRFHFVFFYELWAPNVS